MRESKLYVVIGAKMQELKSAFSSINTNFKNTRTEAQQFQRGIQYAFVGVIPSAQEFNKILDQGVSSADKFTGAINSLSGTTNMMAMMFARNTKEFISFTAGLSAGFGLLSYGISKIQAYNKLNDTGAQINKAMAESNWYLRDSNLKLLESYIAQAEVLPSLSEETKKWIETTKQFLVDIKASDAIYNLANAYGYLTDEQKESYKENKALTDYMNTDHKITMEMAKAKADELAEAYHKTDEYLKKLTDDQKKAAETIEKSWDKILDYLGVYTPEQTQGLELQKSINEYVELTGKSYEEVANELNKILGLQQSIKRLSEGGSAGPGIAGAGAGEVNEAWLKYGGVTEAEIAALKAQGQWDRLAMLTAAAQSINPTTGLSSAREYLNQNLEVILNIDGTTLGSLMVQPLGEAVNQQIQVGG